MSAPRYVNDLHESALWVCVSCVWAAGAMLAWLAVASGGVMPAAVSQQAASHQAAAPGELLGESPQARGSALTLVALGVALATFVLRLPILSSPLRTSVFSDHAVWLLTTCATVNWLGFLALQVPTWTDLLPALLLIGAAEVWFTGLVLRSPALPWLREYCDPAAIARTPADSTPAPETLGEFRCGGPPAAQTLGEFRYDNEPGVAEESPEDAERCEGIERKTVAGFDEQGRRYLSGEIKISLAAGQSTETLSIAFSPPFVGDPHADFECEGAEDDVAIQLVHNTPSGMRLGLRRGASAEPSVFWLHWYAAEVELTQSCNASPSSRALP